MNLAKKVLETIQKQNISEPRLGPTFTIAQAADLIGRTTSAIRVAESDGRLPGQPRNDFGRRENYTLEQLNQMREVFGTQPQERTSVVSGKSESVRVDLGGRRVVNKNIRKN